MDNSSELGKPGKRTCARVTCRANHRIELAGDWTDLPPYCDVHGGRLMNMAIAVPELVVEVSGSRP